MKDATLRLLFAGVLGIVSLLCTLTIVVIGLLRGLAPADTIALSAPFTAITVSAVTFFLGHTNGVSAAKEAPPQGGPP